MQIETENNFFFANGGGEVFRNNFSTFPKADFPFGLFSSKRQQL